MRKHYAKLAKERQKVRKGKQPGATVENLPQLDSGKARDQAGQPLNVSGKSVVRRAGKMLAKRGLHGGDRKSTSKDARLKLRELTIKAVVKQYGTPEGLEGMEAPCGSNVRDVRVAPGFCRYGSIQKASQAATEGHPARLYTAVTVAEFLGWMEPKGGPQKKVLNALNALELIEEGILDRKQFRDLNLEQAEALVTVAMRTKKSSEVAAKQAKTPAAKKKHRAKGITQAGKALGVSGESVARPAGKMLAKDEGKGSHGGNRKSRGIVPLEEYGISQDQSKRWQLVARIPEPRFNCWPFAQTRHGHENGGIETPSAPSARNNGDVRAAILAVWR